MKLKYSYILFIIALFGCASSSKTVQDNKCPNPNSNEFPKLSFGKLQIQNDTLSYSELRQECSEGIVSFQKVIYDKYGKWNETQIQSKNSYTTMRNITSHILRWNDIDLFSDGNNYIVMSYGVERHRSFYFGVMVFDKNGKDMLIEKTNESKKIKLLFESLIRKNDINNEEFHVAYSNDRDLSYFKN